MAFTRLQKSFQPPINALVGLRLRAVKNQPPADAPDGRISKMAREFFQRVRREHGIGIGEGEQFVAGLRGDGVEYARLAAARRDDHEPHARVAGIAR